MYLRPAAAPRATIQVMMVVDNFYIHFHSFGQVTQNLIRFRRHSLLCKPRVKDGTLSPLQIHGENK